MSICRKVVPVAVLMALCLCLVPAAALASPELGVTLTRTTTPVSHSDERMVSQVVVENIASPSPTVGGDLTCHGTPADGTFWREGNPAPTFSYQWLRDGQAIPGATERTYTVAPGDEGEYVQCVITATNDPGGADSPIAFSTVSVPPVAVEPAPVAPISGERLPRLEPLVFGAQVLGSTERCSLPEHWTGESISWSFQWLRNGAPIPGAASSEYTLTAADTVPSSNIQCEAIATDAAGGLERCPCRPRFSPRLPPSAPGAL